MNGKLRKKLRGTNKGTKQKSGGHGPPRPPLESPLSSSGLKELTQTMQLVPTTANVAISALTFRGCP